MTAVYERSRSGGREDEEIRVNRLDRGKEAKYSAIALGIGLLLQRMLRGHKEQNIDMVVSL